MKFKMNLRLKANIVDPVPLVNVFLLFLMFFVLTTKFIGVSGINIVLPDVEQESLYNEDSAVVTIKNDNIFLYDKEVDIKKLQEELTKTAPKLVAIKADQYVTNARVVDIISLIKSAGIKQIAIATSGKKS